VSKNRAVDRYIEPEQLFDPLFEAHYNAIYRYCVRRLGLSDAEDAAAEVFAVAWRRLAELPPGEASRAWLFGVAYRVVGNHYRNRRRRSGLAARLNQARSGDAPGSHLDRDGDFVILYAALDQLSDHDRELLRLSAWDGLTRAEIAVVLGIHENAVDQRLHRARTRLKSRLERLSTGSSRPETTEPEPMETAQ
jgi:RNA polymerase sigma-70 factor (ECF subfamily)